VSLAKQIACWLLVFSLLGTQYSVAVWAQTSPPPIPPEENADPNAEFPLGDQPLPNPLPGSSVVPPSDTAASPQTILPSGAPDAGRAGFSCSNTVLDPRDRQALWDNTLYNGFVGRELSSGAPANKNRPKTDRDTVILPNAENKLAVKQTIPNQQIEPSEIAHLLNKRYNGAFAFGLEVEDSLRVGRCDDPAQSCALLGKALSLQLARSSQSTHSPTAFISEALQDLRASLGAVALRCTAKKPTQTIWFLIKKETFGLRPICRVVKSVTANTSPMETMVCTIFQC
jgi:hypothetical protein